MKRFLILLLLCSVAFAENPYRILSNFNAGELYLLNAREDLAKYHSGCSIMENFIPMPQGGATKRPGTKYIAEVKTSSLATRLIPFEYSTEQSYVIEAGNQYFRFFTDGAAVLTGDGTEDLSTLNNIVAHWTLNDNASSDTVIDDDDDTHPGTLKTGNTEDVHSEGKVGSGSLDLDGTYAVEIDSDAATLSFTDDSKDEPFSIVGWIFIKDGARNQTILSKWQAATLREWKFLVDIDRKMSFYLCDDSTQLGSDLVAQWKMNENAASTAVDNAEGTAGFDGVASANTTNLHAAGKVGSGSFDLDSQYYVTVSDADALSFGNGTVDSPFSVGAWVYVTSSATEQQIITKYDGTTGAEDREWRLFLDGEEKLILYLVDESANVGIGKTSDTGLSEGWHFVAATYTGQSTTGTTAANLITLYVDGSPIAATAQNSGSYDAMEAGASDVIIGTLTHTDGNVGAIFQDKIDNVMLYSTELTAIQISNLYNNGIGTEDLDAGFPYAITQDALSSGWHFVAATYSGTQSIAGKGEDAADDIILYVDGEAAGINVYNEDNYDAMEDTTIKVVIGGQYDSAGTLANFPSNKLDNIALFSDVLTPTEIDSLYTISVSELETPYLTADLFELKYEQSADVLYITHPDYETRKLSRQTNNDWEFKSIAIETGPFRTQNNDITKTLSASATTGTVTLTASGHAPFIASTTAGHLPSGSTSTSKSQTGALFQLVHPLDDLSFSDTLEDDYAASQTEGVSWMDCGTLYKGAEWTWVTDGTWLGTVEIQRNYTIGAAHDADGWETVFPYDGVTTARNVSTTGTEEDGDADYRVIFTDDTSGTVISYFTTDQTEVIGIVEITSVESKTSATGTVIQTLGSTDATYKWSEGAWSNYRGWPQTVTFFEDRLCFGGNTSQPDTIWASVTSDYENMEAGVDDDDALLLTLSSRQVNVIEWLIGKDKLLIGTSGAEWTIAGGTDEPLTPSNVLAKQHSTYGSANLQATLANESVLFFQRGKEKMRELAYNWELDSYVAPDMTILSNLITDSGIDDVAFQKTPDSILWCVRNDGELPVFSYERNENITAWSRMVTQTNQAGTLTDSDFESVARIHGDPEDEVWVIVERTIDSSVVRYIEQFQPRDFGDDEDAFFVDCGITYDSTASSAMTGLDHLEGETVYVLADGVMFDTAIVSGGAITLKSGGTTTTASTVQIGLGYEAHMRTMPLSWVGGTTIHGKQKRISEVISEWNKSGDFSIGKDADTLQAYSIDGQTTDIDRKTFPAGWDRNGYVYIYQQSPEPLTLLSIMTEFNIN